MMFYDSVGPNPRIVRMFMAEKGIEMPKPVIARTTLSEQPLLLVLAMTAVAAPPNYKIVNKIKIGGAGRWDYSFVDAANHRLYVSHGTQTEVIDTATEKLVGTIEGTNGVHGIAIAADLGRGYTSDGGDNDGKSSVLARANAYSIHDGKMFRSLLNFGRKTRPQALPEARAGDGLGPDAWLNCPRNIFSKSHTLSTCASSSCRADGRLNALGLME